MEDRISLKILSPSGCVLERGVEYVSLPTEEGPVGVLAGHAPMYCALAAGKLRFRCSNGSEGRAALRGGAAKVGGGEVLVLTDGAELE